MPTITTTVPAAIDALLAAITTTVAADSQANQILIAEVLEQADDPLEVILVAEAEETLSIKPFCFTGGMTARNSMFETYTLDVKVSKYEGSYLPDDLIQRTFVLCGYVENAVRSDPSLGGTVLVAYPESRRVLSPEWAGEVAGLLMEVTIPIHVEASL